ncbi:ficolin-3-like [Clavelina lepadiformis]|uniref:Fibrinogen C-terminal domain-containing protein n=1 Tax=Clavelina lepadiformis TaxID=159417 RepID=A0ABP0GKR4_CLALP
MQLHTVLILISSCLLLVWMQNVMGTRQVTLTCGDDNGDGNRGLPGVPGKQGRIGPQGLQGPKGHKGDPGTCDNCGSLEGRLANLESRLHRLARLINSRNCMDVKKSGAQQSGVYDVIIDGKITSVYCDMETDGGGWMVIHRRMDGSTDFYRNWESYTNGFGNISHEFWLGLDNLHAITDHVSYQLRVELEDWENDRRFAKYSSFSIGAPSTHYQLTVGGYSGNAGDSMSYHNGRLFSAFDADNDDTHKTNCAIAAHGAWWYGACYHSNLNGQYLEGQTTTDKSMSWNHFHGTKYSLKLAEMKIKPQ